MPPHDVALDSMELLEAEYILGAGAAILLESVPRPAAPPPQARAAAANASQIYKRMEGA